MALLAVECGVGATSSNVVITGTPYELISLLVWLEVFGIAGVA